VAVALARTGRSGELLVTRVFLSVYIKAYQANFKFRLLNSYGGFLVTVRFAVMPKGFSTSDRCLFRVLQLIRFYSMCLSLLRLGVSVRKRLYEGQHQQLAQPISHQLSCLVAEHRG